jgi:hypothetical protein
MPGITPLVSSPRPNSRRINGPLPLIPSRPFSDRFSAKIGVCMPPAPSARPTLDRPVRLQYITSLRLPTAPECGARGVANGNDGQVLQQCKQLPDPTHEEDMELAQTQKSRIFAEFPNPPRQLAALVLHDMASAVHSWGKSGLRPAFLPRDCRAFFDPSPLRRISGILVDLIYAVSRCHFGNQELICGVVEP